MIAAEPAVPRRNANREIKEKGHDQDSSCSNRFVCAAASAQAQSFSIEELARRMIERRAVEAVIWGMPAVNYHLMLQEMLTKTDAQVNQIVYWGRPLPGSTATER